ncbi:MAG: hypothetical protein QM820_35030 [Minicystis sp.]
MNAGQLAHTDIPFWGIDLPPENRPGVPYEGPPRPLLGAHWITPARQVPVAPVLRLAGIPRLTPVFGTAVPPHGISGAMRRAAYKVPDHRTSHWLLLLMADRVDVIESDVGGFVKRSWPVIALAAVAGAGIGALRQRRRRRGWRLI